MLELDPELRPIFEAVFAGAGAMPKLPRGDWQGRRKAQEAVGSSMLNA